MSNQVEDFVKFFVAILENMNFRYYGESFFVKAHCLNFQNQVLPALCCPFPQLRPLVSLWLQIVNWGCPLDSYHKEANPHRFYVQLSLAKVWELYHFPPQFLWSQSDQPIGKVSLHLEKVIKMSGVGLTKDDRMGNRSLPYNTKNKFGPNLNLKIHF